MIYGLFLNLIILNHKSFPFSRFTVEGISMLPTLKPGQDILCFKRQCVFFQPKVGDMVVIRKNGKEMVKRISKITKTGYFVEGDNKKESTDSRDFGPVSKLEIVGKVVYVR
ncbi:S26 family signal peptidase [Candidatus Daviesbacteria bacterium]|nr:S26 family signal peptidase [Candidatus Daviesbacteria bacterium]